jgi:hypothetical protein
MKNTQKGFIGIAIIIVIALIAVGGGTYVYTQQKMNTNIDSNIEVETNSTSTTSITTTNSIQESLEEAKDNLNTSVGKNLVTEATVRTDSKGNPIPALIVDPSVAAEIVVEKYGSNPTYLRQLIKVQLMAMAAGLQAEASQIKSKNGSHASVCERAGPFLYERANENLNYDDELTQSMNKSLNITIDSYRINELVCKSNDSGFVATLPLTLEDGTNTKMCMSSKGSAYGEPDFENQACIKKY